LGARSRPLSRFCVTAALSVGLLITPGAAQATPTGNPVAWGCEGIGAWGQCTVPLGLTSATAIAAGYYSGLALKSDGTVVAWGCGMLGVQGACNVPSDLSGVTRIAAGKPWSPGAAKAWAAPTSASAPCRAASPA
jgi:Regulator of chromosome condensation (RCC1) repeat